MQKRTLKTDFPCNKSYENQSNICSLFSPRNIVPTKLEKPSWKGSNLRQEKTRDVKKPIIYQN